MRIVNVMIYLLLLGGAIVSTPLVDKANIKMQKWRRFVIGHRYIGVLLLVINTISLVMTFVPKQKDIYIEKSTYGQEETEIPFLLQWGEETEEISLTVSARELRSDELEKKVKEAFLYLEEHIKGDNKSLDRVCENLDYSLDIEQFPFDIEFVSEDSALIDAEGIVNNEKENLLSMGFTEKEIVNGIPIHIDATLWYGEESFQHSFLVRIYAKEISELEQRFANVKDFLVKEEQKALYDEGFNIPSTVDEIHISRIDKTSISSGQVLIVGIVLVILLLLREYENKRKSTEQRKNNLIRSYPWFVNELVLLLGAGMQVRNILAKLIKDYESRREPEDYRKPLMEELYIAVRAMELGMTEEQAYYKLGRRLEIPCYVKIMALLEQNVKRGGKGLIAVLEQEDVIALEERKNLAKRYGEEAGTKLLGPMILLLLVVMLMIMIPALWGFIS